MYEKTVFLSAFIYSIWCFYFGRQILEKRTSSVKTLLLIVFTHMIIIVGGRKILPSTTPVFILTHSAQILSIFLYHYGSVKKKLLTYILFTGTVMLLEMLIMSLFSCIKGLLYHHESSVLATVSVQSYTDLLIMTTIMVTLGSLLCKIIADLSGTFVRFSRFTTLVQIFFPFYWFLIAASLLYSFNLGSSYKLIFLAISVPAILVFIKGLQNIRIQEKSRILYEKQIDLIKKQLTFFDEIELEYQELRKWNHDIENHLLSINYLMKNQNYEEALQYSHNISAKEDDNAH